MNGRLKNNKVNIMSITRSFSCLKILSAILITLLLESCEKKNHTDHTEHIHHDTVNNSVYYCPMDTQIVSDKPGTCPICKMDLELKSGHHHTDHVSTSGDIVYKPANVSVLSSVRTIKAVQKTVPVVIEGNGYITYDTRLINNISARISGRVEKLYIKYKYQPVKKGDPLFDIYSHELLSAQQDYLWLRNNDSENQDMVEASIQKLRLLGMTNQQLNQLGKNHHVHPVTTIFSPYSGFAVGLTDQAENVPDNPETGMGTGSAMNSEPEMQTTPEEEILREGTYVNKGQAVFRIANTRNVWAVTEIFSGSLPDLKLNIPAEITVEGTDQPIRGKINFIEPALTSDQKSIRIRMDVNNKTRQLKIGNLIKTRIQAGNKSGLWIPSGAVYDLGKVKIVFVKTNGAFVTKEVNTGYTTGNETEVISGISETDEIAADAQFMVDSESFVKTESE
jgi:membrane fusion protein, copper/silver efflux system